jgi:hypothetical protein
MELYHLERLANAVNSKFHESTPIFTRWRDDVLLRNNYLDGRLGKDEQRVVLLKLYKSTLIDGKWSNIVALPFNE